MRKWVCLLLAPVFSILLLLGLATAGFGQGTTGTIRGTVVDSSGAAIPGATVKLTNTSTGAIRVVSTGATGIFVANLMPPGTYTAVVTKGGFKTYTQPDIVLQAASTYVVSATLEVGALSQTVEVKATPLQINKTTMELGGELAGTQVTNFPLLNLNWLNLQQTLPGVMASSDRFGNNFSTNGNRTQANDYTINGMDANDAPLNTAFGTGVNPLNPDAIQEVKVVDSTSNPEYGRNSGAIVNVVTKSGTNHFHGTAYDYYRTTGFNARTFFQPTTPPFHQNQFGATLGGPVLHNKLFFFFGYQGVRLFQGTSANTPVFSAAQRGNGLTYADWSNSVADAIATLRENNQTGAVSPYAMYGDAASPCPVTSGHMCPAGTYYFNPNDLSHSLFSTGQIPKQDFNSITKNLMDTYVPLPNTPQGTYAFPNNNTYVSDQYLGRLDFHPTSSDSAYFYFMVQPMNNPSTLPFYGGDLPGFGMVSHQNIYRYTLSETHIINPQMVNEFRIGWQRLNYLAVYPQNPTQPSSAGFTGIVPQDTAGAGLPYLGVDSYFSLGFSYNGPQPRIDDTGEITDNLSYVRGEHNFRIGADVRRVSVYNPFMFVNNGYFGFSGGGTFSTGVSGMDYLLGIPDFYEQTSGNVINARTWLIYSFAQDQWQVRPNLTLTYGVGWQINTPLTDLYNNGVAINAFHPGQQSTVFPLVTDSNGNYVSGAPTGLLFPGDTNVNSAGGVVTHLNNFAPRFGFAYNPIQKLVVRGGWGIYYDNATEEMTLQNLNAPPFSLTNYGVGNIGLSPALANPYASINPAPVCISKCGTADQSVMGAGSTPQLYPFTPPAPGSAVDFSTFEPMALNVMDPNFNVPYVMNMNLTTQYQVTPTTVVTVGYVGSLGRRLTGVVEGNPYNAQAYISQCNPDNTAEGAQLCQQLRYNAPYYYPNIGKYGDLVPVDTIASVGTQSTFLNSNYNSLQITVEKAMSHGLYIRGAYTYGHALDYGSSFENSQGLIDPYNYALAYGDSEYDARQRLVIQYQYDIPNWSFGVLPQRLTKGWGFSGITTFQTGFPVPLYESDYRSYECSPQFSFYGCWDRPQVTGTPVQNLNPRNTTGNLWFNGDAYASENYGTVGNAGRNLPFHGPGINMWDMSFWKDTTLAERTSLQLRLDMFNVWNHANFALPDSTVNLSHFGQILNTTGTGRVLQLSAHFYF